MSEGVWEVGGSSPAHDEHEAVDDDADVEEPVQDTHEVAVERGEVAETLDPGTHHQHGEALVEAKAGVYDDHPVQEGLALLPKDEVDEAAVGGDNQEDGEPLHQLHCLHTVVLGEDLDWKTLASCVTSVTASFSMWCSTAWRMSLSSGVGPGATVM